MKLLSLLVLLVLPLSVHAENGAAPPNHVMEKALSWMQSADPAKRAAAFRTVHLLDEDALPAFEGALRRAQLHHEKKLGELLRPNRGKGNPIRETADLRDELKTERERVSKLIRTDYKKDPGKIRMLHDEMEKLTRLFDRMTKVAKQDPAEIEKGVDEFSHALADLTAEIAHFDDPESKAEAEPLETRKQDALRESFEGELYLNNRKKFEASRKAHDRLAATESSNGALPWTKGHHTDFATHLNHQRAVLGLQPLELQEQLSKAAFDHSNDMKRLGFFAHESPVEGKRTPGMRAKKAGYKGGLRGENIAMGYSNSGAAYHGWFGSDGHRFIMFGQSPAECGLGRAGAHWTFMTGK